MTNAASASARGGRARGRAASTNASFSYVFEEFFCAILATVSNPARSLGMDFAALFASNPACVPRNDPAASARQEEVQAADAARLAKRYEKDQAARARYEASEKRQASIARYEASEKGQSREEASTNAEEKENLRQRGQ